MSAVLSEAVVESSSNAWVANRSQQSLRRPMQWWHWHPARHIETTGSLAGHLGWWEAYREARYRL